MPIPEACFLLVKKTFDVTGDRWLVVGEVVYSLEWYGGVFTESNVFRNAFWLAVDVLPMRSTLPIPVRQPKAVLHGVFRPCSAPHSPWVVAGFLSTKGT